MYQNLYMDTIRSQEEDTSINGHVKSTIKAEDSHIKIQSLQSLDLLTEQ